MRHPWVRVAAMVVSEINERLSPKKALRALRPRKRHVAALRLCKFYGQRGQSHHRAHRCAYGKGDEACRGEQSRNQHLYGEETQGEMYGCLYGADFTGDGGKGSGQE